MNAKWIEELTLVGVGIAAVWMMFSGGAAADVVANGTQLNVRTYNGVGVNGTRLSNGMRLNGLRMLNGTSFNGTRVSGELNLYLEKQCVSDPDRCRSEAKRAETPTSYIP